MMMNRFTSPTCFERYCDYKSHRIQTFDYLDILVNCSLQVSWQYRHFV